MTVYELIGCRRKSADAAALAARLAEWHDEMVAHERRVRAAGAARACHDDCPHTEAGALWTEARELFGEDAEELTFLRARARTHDGARTSSPA